MISSSEQGRAAGSSRQDNLSGQDRARPGRQICQRANDLSGSGIMIPKVSDE